MVRPLRAAHEVITNPAGKSQSEGDRRRNRDVDPRMLKAGVALLLDVNPLSLVELSESARRRLFHLGCEMLRSQPTIRVDTLQQLLESLSFSQPSEQLSAIVSLVAAMLGSEQEAAAKKLIERVRKPDDTGSILARWRMALDAPRVGTVALESSRSNRELPPCGRWYRGWHVPTQSIVLVRYGELGEQPIYAEQVAHWRRLLIPGTSRIVTSSTVSAKRPYIAVELPGFPLNREMQKGHRVEERLRLRWAVEYCSLLLTMAQQGFVLPDAELNRFNTDQEGRLWLIDLWGMQTAEPDTALRLHCDQARNSCRQLLTMAHAYSVSSDALERLEVVPDLTQMARIFET